MLGREGINVSWAVFQERYPTLNITLIIAPIAHDRPWSHFVRSARSNYRYFGRGKYVAEFSPLILRNTNAISYFHEIEFTKHYWKNGDRSCGVRKGKLLQGEDSLLSVTALAVTLLFNSSAGLSEQQSSSQLRVVGRTNTAPLKWIETSRTIYGDNLTVHAGRRMTYARLHK